MRYDGFLIVATALAFVGAVVVGRWILVGLSVALYAAAFVVAGEEHPDGLDRIADVEGK